MYTRRSPTMHNREATPQSCLGHTTDTWRIAKSIGSIQTPAGISDEDDPARSTFIDNVLKRLNPYNERRFTSKKR